MVNFTNKRVAILGLGVEGQDVVPFLLLKKAKITVFDQKNAVELGAAYRQFKDKVQFKLGKDYLRDGLTGFDIIFRSPAFKLSLPEIRVAKKAGREISSATKLFFQLCPAKIIGVTGTKGKGTTATLIYRILKVAGKKVFLAGNIGEPMLRLLPKLDSQSWVILELSSFQLQDLKQSPSIAVVLFITSEHLDYHQNTQEYIEAKTNLVRYQKKNDFSVLNADNKASASFAKLTKGKIFYFSRQKKTKAAYVQKGKIFSPLGLVGETKNLLLRGEHNQDNICAAISAAWLAGADLKAIKKVVFAFFGYEHRLELVKKIKGVSFYNDSASTAPETTIAAIKSFQEPIVLIAGGSEKGADFSQLGQVISQSPIKSLLLIGQMAKRIKKAALRAGFQGEIIEGLKTMKQVVQTSLQKVKPGEVVLFSPACASFDMFANYKDRGQQFKKYVQALARHS